MCFWHSPFLSVFYVSAPAVIPFWKVWQLYLQDVIAYFICCPWLYFVSSDIINEISFCAPGFRVNAPASGLL